MLQLLIIEDIYPLLALYYLSSNRNIYQTYYWSYLALPLVYTNSPREDAGRDGVST